MIHIEFESPVTDPTWCDWQQQGEKRRKEIERKLAAGKSYRIDDDFYKKPREYFLRAFHDKCAYCETKVTPAQQYGDVEHFRPKGRVTDERGRPVKIRAGGSGPAQPHPGYPWLAYHPGNLLPSCISCNRPYTLRTGERVGKWDQFPVARFRARAPGEETRERPLLLHPALDDPEEHLSLQLETGRLLCKTRRGEVTIKILGLNREGLPEERRRVVNAVKALVVAAQNSLENGDLAEARSYLADLESYKDGSAQYAWAGRLTLAELGRRGG